MPDQINKWSVFTRWEDIKTHLHDCNCDNSDITMGIEEAREDDEQMRLIIWCKSCGNSSKPFDIKRDHSHLDGLINNWNTAHPDYSALGFWQTGGGYRRAGTINSKETK